MKHSGDPLSRPWKRPARDAWRQYGVTLAVLLIAAAALLPIVGGLVRMRLGDQQEGAVNEFRKAVVLASDSHGRLLAALSGQKESDAAEQLDELAYDDPPGAMTQYARLQAAYEQWMKAQGRTDLQPTLDTARQTYGYAVDHRELAVQLARRRESVFGEYLRYAGFTGASGLLLLLWGSLGAFARPRARSHERR
jgi:hypothetical protein